MIFRNCFKQRFSLQNKSCLRFAMSLSYLQSTTTLTIVKFQHDREIPKNLTPKNISPNAILNVSFFYIKILYMIFNGSSFKNLPIQKKVHAYLISTPKKKTWNNVTFKKYRLTGIVFPIWFKSRGTNNKESCYWMSAGRRIRKIEKKDGPN